MNLQDIEQNPELQCVLIACCECWKRETLPQEDRAICYSWVIGIYRELFGADFHPTMLYQLTKLGYLSQDYTARGGHRRYYRIVNPALVKSLVNKWVSRVA